MAAITLFCFICGFLTCLNNILIEQIRPIFELSYAKVMLLQFCFFFAYFVGSIPSGKLVQRIGVKAGLTAGLCIAGTGAALFYPAAEVPSFPLFLAALFILALGITLIQISGNLFIILLEPRAGAGSRLSLTQAFNSLGTTLAPIFGASLLLRRGLSEISQDRFSRASAIKGPYLIFTFILFILALIIFLIPMPEESNKSEEKNGSSIPQLKSIVSDGGGLLAKIFSNNVLWNRKFILGVIGIFVYVGAEVCIGSFLVVFLTDPKIVGISADQAARYSSLYWGGAMAGRFIGAWIMTRVKPASLLAFNGTMAALLVLVALSSTGPLATFSILSVGVFNSIMMPTILFLALEGTGNFVSEGSGILNTAVVGGAIMPVLQGGLADFVGVHNGFVVPVMCYLFIIYYALKGSGFEKGTSEEPVKN